MRHSDRLIDRVWACCDDTDKGSRPKSNFSRARPPAGPPCPGLSAAHSVHQAPAPAPTRDTPAARKCVGYKKK